MEPLHLYYPVLAMALLVGLVMIRLLMLRVRFVRRRDVKMRHFRAFAGDAPEPLLAIRNHVGNLFELPVLFYVVCLFAVALDRVEPLTIGLAWLYVVLRYLHSLVHLTYNHVGHRLTLFILSNIVLLGIFGRVAIQ